MQSRSFWTEPSHLGGVRCVSASSRSRGVVLATGFRHEVVCDCGGAEGLLLGGFGVVPVSSADGLGGLGTSAIPVSGDSVGPR